MLPERIYNAVLSTGLAFLLCVTASARGVDFVHSCAGEPVILENGRMKLTVNPDGYAESLVCKATGEECLEDGVRIPLCAVLQDRPYDNENFLMFPAKPRIFPSEKITRSGDTLYVEFKDTYDIAVIAVDVKDDYIGFSLVRRDYRIEDYGVKRKTEIDGFSMIQLPVRSREHFGEWLNTVWDDRAAVAVIGTEPASMIDTFDETGGYKRMYAGMDADIKLFGADAALIVCPPDSLLDCIASVEEDYGMPRGVESRRSREYGYSYYELRDVTPENIDEHISFARAGGFRTMVVYYTDFASSCGHYLWKDSFPCGIEDLKKITGKIEDAGMIPGLHIHYSKVSVTDPYMCGGRPDPRIGHVNPMMLARPLAADDTVIHVESVPSGLRMEDGRRLVHIGDELVSFGSVDGNCLKGCVRGLYGSVPSSYLQGTRFSQVDVDDWSYFIRIDQNTSIQKEIAHRLGGIYGDAGFRFVYFDGAEDVPEPYWYNVSRSQSAVYDELQPAPLFSEGALKSHYGWHILTRGNAFDHFPPEKIRQAMKRYTLRCAEKTADDFTSVNFGWLTCLAPSEESIGMQPDMYEYVCSKAVAWDCPISLVGILEQMEHHPRMADNLEVIRRWEEAKLSDAIAPEQKEMLKDPDREFILFGNAPGEYCLYEYHMLTTDSPQSRLRAFLFVRDGKNCVVYWNPAGDGTVSLDPHGYGFRLTDMDGKRVPFGKDGDRLVLPAGKRLVLETDMPEDMLRDLFAGDEVE